MNIADVSLRMNQKKDDSDSGTLWTVIPKRMFGVPLYMSAHKIEAIWQSLGGVLYYRCSHGHDCCGCMMYNTPVVRHTRTRILIRQSYGRNV